MDKNFVKIDDLVRQRLGGVEEKEPAGAWGRMHDLLDREMPQKRRIGIFYWRRIFSAVAVLSLVGTVCVGSYELASVHRKRLVADIPAPSVNREAEGSLYRLGAQTSEAGTAASADADPDGRANGESDSKQVQKGRYVAAAAGTTNHDAPSRAIITTPIHTTDNPTQSQKPNTSTTGKAIKNHTENNTPKTVQHIHHATAQVADAGAATTTVNVKHLTTATPSLAVNASPATGSAATQPSGAAKSHNTANAASGTSATGVPAKSAGIAAANTTNPSGTAIPKQHTDRLALNGQAAGNTAHATLPNPTTVAIPATESKASQPSAAGTSATQGAPLAANTGAASSGTTAQSAQALSAHANAGKTNTDRTTTDMDRLDNTAVAAKSTGYDYSTGGALKKNPSPENTTSAKRVITKVLVHQRSIKISDNTYAYPLDTISTEKISMDVKPTADEIAAAENATATTTGAKAAKPAAKKGGSGSNNSATAANTTASKSSAGANGGGYATGGAVNKPHSASGNAGDENEESTEAMSALSAAAVTPESATPAVAAEQKKEATKKSGASLVQKLSAAFNDIKTNMAHPQFTGGIAAGINANYFGPKSFKGFQFGVTGNLAFNEQWSIMSELKYFHRLAGNTSVEDDYYTYTPMANGTYRKDKQSNSYSFSALHTLEMPVAVRYSVGNFSFYAGANLVYSFSINTGAATMPDPNATPEYVNAIGNDNAPKYTEQDFKSRFGLGYLLGFNYQVAPNTSLDLRSVQTVWDNAATTGAKAISGQLYKSPSLQLSIMYRIGRNRDKE